MYLLINKGETFWNVKTTEIKLIEHGLKILERNVDEK